MTSTSRNRSCRLPALLRHFVAAASTSASSSLLCLLLSVDEGAHAFRLAKQDELARAGAGMTDCRDAWASMMMMSWSSEDEKAGPEFRRALLSGHSSIPEDHGHPDAGTTPPLPVRSTDLTLDFICGSGKIGDWRKPFARQSLLGYAYGWRATHPHVQEDEELVASILGRKHREFFQQACCIPEPIVLPPLSPMPPPVLPLSAPPVVGARSAMPASMVASTSTTPPPPVTAITSTSSSSSAPPVVLSDGNLPTSSPSVGTSGSAAGTPTTTKKSSDSCCAAG
ncbi:unnamed protein product [Amoebophrya sp. A25]|nr:unnamed protein product [Amoebophrya sp. A25]|eukprot:GSA25T00002989001.1